MITKSSEHIKKARKKLKLTQRELAEKLDVERYNLAKYERGISMPPGDLILKLEELIKRQRPCV
jgi:transcriptional regulator with XRE-family HTH domain